ncbi:hypothetical protein SALBM311S_01248 [Streptomyces alboniger]
MCAESGRGQTAKPSGVATQAVCARDRRGSAVYATTTVRPALVRQATHGRDPQFLADLLEVGPAARDADGRDIQAEGVQGEAAQGLGGADLQRRRRR